MPTYITQGRYTREAINLVRPEDRAAEVARLLGKVGRRLIGYYFTFGPDCSCAARRAGGGGGVTDLKTTLALTSIEAKAPWPRRAI